MPYRFIKELAGCYRREKRACWLLFRVAGNTIERATWWPLLFIYYHFILGVLPETWLFCGLVVSQIRFHRNRCQLYSNK